MKILRKKFNPPHLFILSKNSNHLVYFFFEQQFQLYRLFQPPCLFQSPQCDLVYPTKVNAAALIKLYHYWLIRLNQNLRSCWNLILRKIYYWNLLPQTTLAACPPIFIVSLILSNLLYHWHSMTPIQIYLKIIFELFEQIHLHPIFQSSLWKMLSWTDNF